MIAFSRVGPDGAITTIITTIMNIAITTIIIITIIIIILIVAIILLTIYYHPRRLVGPNGPGHIQRDSTYKLTN